MFFLAPWLNTLRSSLREFNGARQMTRISRVFVFFVVSLRIQASELLRANNPPEGEKGKGQWSGVRGQGSGVSCQGKTVVGGQGSGVGSQGSGSEDGSYPG